MEKLWSNKKNYFLARLRCDSYFICTLFPDFLPNNFHGGVVLRFLPLEWYRFHFFLRFLGDYIVHPSTFIVLIVLIFKQVNKFYKQYMSLISSRLDFKSYLKGSIWYHSESLEVLYSGPRAVSYSKSALVKSFPKYLPIFHFISTVLRMYLWKI